MPRPTGHEGPPPSARTKFLLDVEDVETADCKPALSKLQSCRGVQFVVNLGPRGENANSFTGFYTRLRFEVDHHYHEFASGSRGSELLSNAAGIGRNGPLQE